MKETENREASRRQCEVLLVVLTYMQRHGYPPTLREITREMGICSQSVNSVAQMLIALKKKGYVLIDKNHSRRPRRHATSRTIRLAGIFVQSLHGCVYPVVEMTPEGFRLAAALARAGENRKKKEVDHSCD